MVMPCYGALLHENRHAGAGRHPRLNYTISLILIAALHPALITSVINR
jgi:hypothetical protein